MPSSLHSPCCRTPSGQMDICEVQAGEECWRPSRIARSRQIAKTKAIQQYRVKDTDLVGLEEKREVIHVVIKGRPANVVRIMYNEREVERLAWRRHGGPDGFESYLETLRERYKARSPDSPFKEPTAYKPSKKRTRRPVLATNIYPPTPSPVLVKLQKRIVRKAAGKTWLLNTCTEIIQGTTDSPFIVPSEEQQIACLRHALDKLPDYPTRTVPPSTLPQVFQNLRTLLDEAPPKGARIHHHLLVSHDVDTGVENLFWTDAYLERVFRALINVIQSRGWGPKSGQAARWMVYDKFSESVGGISVTPLDRPAFDKAHFWVSGHIPERKIGQKMIFCSRPTPSWYEYNDLLLSLE
ncbi:hypothetical protein BKA70DRAFT_1153141 [Coprinopsis sp. MPI-PUGE-AT-0042]|nr:hypothetical protein BKA70DRAFT_1153141 [Coprinopsis sp. MPI-PUGE-AT-0042]